MERIWKMISLHGIILRKDTQEDIDSPYIQTNGGN